MKEITDSHILSLLKKEANYERGFRLLMDKYQERLYLHIRRMLNNHEDTNDVLQNVFIKVYKSINRFEGKAKLYTWLYRIATNETLTFIKQKKKRQYASINDEDKQYENLLVATPFIDGNDIQQKLQYALTTLPEKQRMVFHLRYYDEMPYADMSVILETSVGALKASYHHAAKKIEAFFKEQGMS